MRIAVLALAAGEDSPLTERQKCLFREGAALFNRSRFFECHEVLEELWLESSGERKLFLQGLIQIAVALHHFGNRNFLGARRLLEAGAEKISRHAHEAPPMNVGALQTALVPLRQQLRSGEIAAGLPMPQIIVEAISETSAG